MLDKDRTGKIITASWIAVAANAFLAILKIAAGLIAGSLAVVADGIDSGSDIITSLITLLTAGIISRPPNLKFPYGYRKADTIATKALSFIIFFAGAQLAFSSAGKIFSGGDSAVPGILAVYAIIISVISKLFLSFYLLQTGKNLGSSMLIANGKNMKNDVFISLSVLAGLFFTIFFKIPLIDSVIAFLISFWIMKVGYNIFMETSVELMDGISDPSIYRKIFEILSTIQGVNNPHRVRARKLADLYVIEIDIEVDPALKISEAHSIATTVENTLKEKIENIYDIIVHIEPLGNLEKDEKFGIRKEDVIKSKK